MSRQIPAWHGPGEVDINASIFLTVREAAEFLRLSEITLSRWRTEGSGPSYRKFGRRVLYARADVVAWADDQKLLSTSDRSAQAPKRRPRGLCPSLQRQSVQA